MPQRSFWLVGVVIAAVLWGQGATALRGDVNTLMYNTLKSSDATLVAASTSSISAMTSVMWQNTKSLGFGTKTQTVSNDIDRCLHMNTMSELLVVMAALQLQTESTFPASDKPLDTRWTPMNLTFRNPKNSINITYKHLMQHTSSIVDTSFDSFVSTTSVGSQASFVKAYFTTTSISTGAVSLNGAVFSTNEPGLPTSYAFARANIALLSFIIESFIASDTLLSAQYPGGLFDYITVKFLTPFGMSSTFFLGQDGSAPLLTTIPSFTGTFSGLNFSSNASTTTYFAGCVFDMMGPTRLLHPAKFADYMGYTTLGDITRLIRGMFFSTTYSTIVSLMKDILSISSATARTTGHIGQGLGLMYFSPATICSSGSLTNVISGCPLWNVTTVLGYVSNRDYVEQGFFCATPPGSAATAGLICTATQVLHTTASTRSALNVMAMSSATFQDLAGNVTVPQAPVPAAVPLQVQSQWFGVYCFIGVYLSLMGVHFGAQLLQWLFQPAALATAAESSGAASLAYSSRPTVRRDANLVADE